MPDDVVWPHEYDVLVDGLATDVAARLVELEQPQRAAGRELIAVLARSVELYRAAHDEAYGPRRSGEPVPVAIAGSVSDPTGTAGAVDEGYHPWLRRQLRALVATVRWWHQRLGEISPAAVDVLGGELASAHHELAGFVRRIAGEPGGRPSGPPSGPPTAHAQDLAQARAAQQRRRDRGET